MTVGKALREAELVERIRARQAYEDHVRAPEPRDPLLFEHVAGNRFAARVYPIAAREEKRIVVAWSHELASPTAPYMLPLAGLSAVETLDVTLVAGDQIVRVLEHDTVPTDLALTSAPRGGADPDRGDGVAAGDLAVIRVAPEIVDAEAPTGSLLVLFDTSASQAGAPNRSRRRPRSSSPAACRGW